MYKPYTGSTQDIQALDVYLESVMQWIEDIKQRYSIDSVNCSSNNDLNPYVELDK